MNSDAVTVAASDGRRVWECDVCSRRDYWSNDWQHYSSIRVLEDCGHLVVTCSAECRNTVRACQLVQDFEKTHRVACGIRATA